MVIKPFRHKQPQKTSSIALMIIGFTLIMVSAPFSIKLGSWAIASTTVGGILVVVGLIYFIDVVS